MIIPPPMRSPEELSALLRGQSDEPLAVHSVALDSLHAMRLKGILPAPGHGPLDLEAAWSSSVRAWWGMGLSWAMVAGVEEGELVWRLALPRSLREGTDIVRSHLPGASWGEAEPFSPIAARLGCLPHRLAMAGHVAAASHDGGDPALRALLEGEGLLLIVAVPAPRTEVEGQLREHGQIEQFLREEYLARPGLERDNHVPAAACLELIEASRQRLTHSLAEGGWWVRTILAAADAATLERARGSLQGAFASEESGRPEPVRWQSLEARRKLTFLCTAELAALTRPPRRELPGFTLDSRLRGAPPHRDLAGEGELFASSAPTLPSADGPAIALGRILDDGGTPRQWLELPLDDLCRHLLVAGMTGSGKSITCEHLLLELWCEHRIPWMVIEPGMKTGYRRLLRSELGGDLALWSVGDPRSRQLALNPLAAPPGIALAEHTAALFAILASAFELVPPMPEVLATAIERTYERHGWNLAGFVPDSPPPPFSALVEEVDRCSRELGYGPEVAGNIRAGLLLRLNRLLRGPLAPELGSAAGIEIGALVSKPALVELSSLPDAASQALVSGLVALGLRHHWRLAGESDTLRHALVIEEAHRLMKAMPETAANAARVRAGEDFAHLLAELRGFGVGLVVVDQTPSALIPSVIANTGTKILHRLDHSNDRESVGRAAGLPADQVDLLGTLGVGQTVIRTDRRPRPYRLLMPNPSLSYRELPAPSTDHVCLGCRSAGCGVRAAAIAPNTLRSRLAEMQGALLRGEDALWQWSRCSMDDEGLLTESLPPSAPLCYLMALGEAIRLSPETLARLRLLFESRDRPAV